MDRAEVDYYYATTWHGPEELKPKIWRNQLEKDTWHAVVCENEYGLPDTLKPEDTVLDLGAHIGSFAYLAYTRGSRSVYAYEIDPWHIEAAMVNLSDMKDGVGLHHGAVVRGDEHRSPVYRYDGAWNSFGQFGPPVQADSLDEIISAVTHPGEHVRFLKVDIEGAEWPTLYTCKQLNRVDEIAGEYHERGGGVPEMENLPYPCTAVALKAFLESKGFEVELLPHGDNIGNFAAKRGGKTNLQANEKERLCVQLAMHLQVMGNIVQELARLG